MVNDLGINNMLKYALKKQSDLHSLKQDVSNFLSDYKDNLVRKKSLVPAIDFSYLDSRDETNLKRNSELLNKLHEALGGTPENLPRYDLRDAKKPIDSLYAPEATFTDGTKSPAIVGSNKVNDFNDAALSHEMAHATSPFKNSKNRLMRGVHKLSLLTQDPRYTKYIVGAPIAGQFIAGPAGAAVGSIPLLANLAEEGQANIRGALALRKVNGKLTGRNLATYAKSMGSYTKPIVDPLLSSMLLNKFAPTKPTSLLGLISKGVKHIKR